MPGADAGSGCAVHGAERQANAGAPDADDAGRPGVRQRAEMRARLGRRLAAHAAGTATASLWPMCEGPRAWGGTWRS